MLPLKVFLDSVNTSNLKFLVVKNGQERSEVETDGSSRDLNPGPSEF